MFGIKVRRSLSDTFNMDGQVRRFISRSPRYVLRPNDNHFMRFAHNQIGAEPNQTEFLNVSESGMAFIVQQATAPRIGEMIKVEFSVPGGEQIAWFAKVVRLEEFKRQRWFVSKDQQAVRDEVIVGVQFHHLPDAHRAAIRDHLQGKFRELVMLRRQRRLLQAREFFKEYGWKIFWYSVLSVISFTVLYFLSLPTPNYDSQRGSPWGQRF